ncbi:MAG: MarR family transcriptional regulator [Methanobrevibacter sp.]|uniref:MarR family winged helix-turn-helix transcriptional regulator n=1 Tax=Methanobrevibacter sp. TaxID=66852 RepID=UPI001B646AD5|nr:MarR family transcriptional regulator [Methanobrevibacter sp.]MBP3790733.1 MarR family transcriptional regulator [Methanobrevibacter sp.]
MKFRNISDLSNEDLKEAPFEFLIMKLNDICLVSLNRKLKELDLTINQANFLVVINTEEKLPQSYISQLLNIRGGSVTKALKRLEAKELVKIYPNPENKSKNIVEITNKGRKTTKEFKTMIENLENEIFEKYSDEEKEKLKIMLRDIAKGYDELNY